MSRDTLGSCTWEASSCERRRRVHVTVRDQRFELVRCGVTPSCLDAVAGCLPVLASAEESSHERAIALPPAAPAAARGKDAQSSARPLPALAAKGSEIRRHSVILSLSTLLLLRHPSREILDSGSHRVVHRDAPLSHQKAFLTHKDALQGHRDRLLSHRDARSQWGSHRQALLSTRNRRQSSVTKRR